MNHHQQVPFHLLKDVPELACGNPGEGNLIVQGDNLVALKALLPYYAGQVKCIYIDPPYNTGNEGWAYNDNVNSPVIREWLGKVVGKEDETLDRHDRWLCMMYPRLALLKRFLHDEGVIFVSIDDDEVHHLRALMDEIFGYKKRLTTFVWRTDGNFDNQAKIKNCHEYVLAYAISPEKFAHPKVVDPTVGAGSKLHKPFIRNTIVKNGIKNPVSPVTLPKGFPADFESGIITARTNAWPKYATDIVVQDRKIMQATVGESGWSSKDHLLQFIGNKFEPVLDTKGQKTRFVLTQTGAIESIKEREQASHVISVIGGVGSTQSQSVELAEMGFSFPFPKPVDLIKYLLGMHSDPDGLILDSFAGSGTTGHAVLKQNAEDGGNRRFILVEMDDHIARNVTTERVRRVAAGYANAKGEHVEGLGGGFRYCELGEPLFDEHGKIRDSVRFADLARHVYFTETGEPYPLPNPPSQAGEGTNEKSHIRSSPLLGECRGVGIYLLYNGILGDKSANGGNVLTRAVLAQLPPFDGPKVIYCAGCLLGRDRLRAENIIVRQTPYEIKVS
ncbi:MAG: site-specific DNA-methyltransferase [Candidatus Nitrotoga sp.]|nr:site-specific DNA-methyltransferase [Candidatus Nitrotoga sp.]